MINYELWYTDDVGNRLELLDNVIAFEYVLVSGDAGWLAVALPYNESRAYDRVLPDRQIHLYRQPTGGALELEAICFGRRWSYTTSASGATQLRLSGHDPDGLMDRRIIGHAAGESESDKTAEADDMMKEIVTEQMGTSAAALRQFDITVQSDQTLGPSISKAFAWQNLLSTLQGIQAASKTEGTEVYFAMVALSPSDFEFQTATGQPGRDRSVSSGHRPLIFGLDRGNVASPHFEEDFSDEATYVYAGGRGQGADRNIQEVSDDDRIDASSWGRIESFVNASNADTDAAVEAAANARLAKKRAKVRFSAHLLNTPETPYGGNGWRQGDKVTVDHLNRSFDVIVKSVHVKVANGQEMVVANAEFEGTLEAVGVS